MLFIADILIKFSTCAPANFCNQSNCRLRIFQVYYWCSKVLETLGKNQTYYLIVAEISLKGTVR
jgi:hypothetical protein